MKKPLLKITNVLYGLCLLLCGGLLSTSKAVAQTDAWEFTLAKPHIVSLTNVTNNSFTVTWNNVSKQQIENEKPWNTIGFRLITTREMEAKANGPVTIANAKITPNPNGTTQLLGGGKQVLLDDQLSQTAWIGSAASWTPSGIMINGGMFQGLPPEMIGSVSRITSPVLDLSNGDRTYTVKFKAKAVGDKTATMQVFGYGEEKTYNSGVPGAKSFTVYNDGKEHEYSFTFEGGTWCHRIIIELQTETKVEFSDAFVVTQTLKKGETAFRSTSYGLFPYELATPSTDVTDLWGYDPYFVNYSKEFTDLDPRCLDVASAQADGERLGCRILYFDARPGAMGKKNYNKSMYSEPMYFDSKEIDNKYFYLGYVGYEAPNYEGAHPGFNPTSGYHGGAIKATKEFLKNNIGDKVVGIRFATAACVQRDEVNSKNIFYSPQVPFIFLAKSLLFKTQEGSKNELIMSKSLEKMEDGWNSFFFDTPYEITSESEFYAGLYAFDEAGKGGIIVSSIQNKTDNPHTYYPASNWETSTFDEAVFQEQSGTIQPLLIQLIVEPKSIAPSTQNKGKLESVTAPKLLYTNETLNATVKLSNTGLKSISNIDIETNVDGTIGNQTIQIPSLVDPSFTKEIAIDAIPFSKESGSKTLEITLKKVNGVALETPSTVSAPITVVQKDEVFKRTALVESFTSEACQYCPDGEHDFYKLLLNPDNEAIASRVAVVSHHSFFRPDFLSMPYSEALFPFFGIVDNAGNIEFASPGSPNIMIDRMPNPGLGDPKGVNGVIYSHISGNVTKFKNALQYSLDNPAYAEAVVKPYFEEATNTLHVLVEGVTSSRLDRTRPLYVTLMVTQNQITPRNQIYNGVPPENFAHHDVLRIVDDANFQGNKITIGEDGRFSLNKDIVINTTTATSGTLPANTILLENGISLKKAMEEVNVIAVLHYYTALPTETDVNEKDERLLKNEVVNVAQRAVSFTNFDNIDSTVGNNFSIYVSEQAIHVVGADVKSFQVYDSIGVLTPASNLIPGVYVVKVNLRNGQQVVSKVLVP